MLEIFFLMLGLYALPLAVAGAAAIACGILHVQNSSDWIQITAYVGQAYTLALRIDQWHRRDQSKFDQRSLSWCFRRPVARAVQYLTGADLDE